MSELEKLIKELCPNGVEYKQITDIFNIKNGYTPSKANLSYWDNGDVDWYRMEDIRQNGNILKQSILKVNKLGVKGKLFEVNSIIISTSATIGEFALIKNEFLCNQRFTCLSLKDVYKKQIEIKYLYHYMNVISKWCLLNTTKSSFASVDMEGFRRLKIPFPPLLIQKEIVRLLDNFAELTAELTAELIGEQTLRQQQYEYYRDKLLGEFEGKVEYKTIEEIAKLSRGVVMSKDYLRDNIGEYPVYSSQTANDGMLGKIKTYNYDGEYLTWTTDGANAGSIFHRTGKFSVTNVCGLIDIDNKYNKKYIYYVLRINSKQYVNAGMGNPKLMSNVMAKIQIPVPSLEEQQRIVDILDRFDALANDINEGLPAEIKLRQQQYEYYRDKLLTFKEKE